MSTVPTQAQLLTEALIALDEVSACVRILSLVVHDHVLWHYTTAGHVVREVERNLGFLIRRLGDAEREIKAARA